MIELFTPSSLPELEFEETASERPQPALSSLQYNMGSHYSPLATMMSTSSAVVAVSQRQRYRRITVASLCCDNHEDTSTSTEPTEQRHPYGVESRSLPDVAPARTLGRHPGRPDTAVTLSAFPLRHPSDPDGAGLRTRRRLISHFVTANSSDSSCDVTSTTDTAIYHPNDTTNEFSITDTIAAHRFDGYGRTNASSPSGPVTTTSGKNAINTLHTADPQVQSMAPSTLTQFSQRVPRAARPPYTEEQKFFIMYHRIIRKMSWPEIEEKFVGHFGTRSEDGLTSVYYRIRKQWGMGEVFENNSRSVDDRSEVEARTCHFSRDFLEKLGYFE